MISPLDLQTLRNAVGDVEANQWIPLRLHTWMLIIQYGHFSLLVAFQPLLQPEPFVDLVEALVHVSIHTHTVVNGITHGRGDDPLQ
jgi:hypothetical protein